MRDRRFVEFEETLDVPLEAGPRQFVVQGGALLHLLVMDADGLPAPRHGIAVTSGVGGAADRVTYGGTNVEGRFTVRLPEGTHGIAVSDIEGFTSKDDVLESVYLRDGEERSLSLRVPNPRANQGATP